MNTCGRGWPKACSEYMSASRWLWLSETVSSGNGEGTAKRRSALRQENPVVEALSLDLYATDCPCRQLSVNRSTLLFPHSGKNCAQKRICAQKKIFCAQKKNMCAKKNKLCAKKNMCAKKNILCAKKNILCAK